MTRAHDVTSLPLAQRLFALRLLAHLDPAVEVGCARECSGGCGDHGWSCGDDDLAPTTVYAHSLLLRKGQTSGSLSASAGHSGEVIATVA